VTAKKDAPWNSLSSSLSAPGAGTLRSSSTPLPQPKTIMGRPRKELDAGKIEALAAEGCNCEEIAAVLDSSEKLIERRFYPSVKKGRQKLHKMLKSALIREVKARNLGAIIFALKVYAGLREPREDGVTVNVSQNSITLTPQQVKANLAELQKVIQSEAKRLNFVNGNGNGEL